MEKRQRKVTRIINAREVKLSGEKMTLFDIGFDMGSGYISGGVTLVERKYDAPKFYSSCDSGSGLFYENYFLGEAEVKWQPKITPRRINKNASYSRFYNFGGETLSDRITDMKEEGFILFLPGRNTNKEFFKKIVAKESKIRKWIKLWHNYESTRYCRACGIRDTSFEEVDLMEKELNTIHDELIEEGLTLEDGTIINPQYIFIFPKEKVKQACYNRSKPNFDRIPSSYKTVKKLGINWITPNVCVTDSEEEFFKLMRECYGITEICK